MENIELDYRIIRLLKNKWGFTDIGITNNISVFVAAQEKMSDFVSWQEAVFQKCDASKNPPGYLIQAIRYELYKKSMEEQSEKNALHDICEQLTKEVAWLRNRCVQLHKDDYIAYYYTCIIDDIEPLDEYQWMMLEEDGKLWRKKKYQNEN